MALSSDNSQEELISNLRQLFIGISPKIRNASSQEEAEDVFARLEETDPDFHRFTMWQNTTNIAIISILRYYNLSKIL